MTMGKGGVGKTTVAAAIAVGLAEPRASGPPDHDRPGRPRRATLKRRRARPDGRTGSTRGRDRSLPAEVLATAGPDLDAAGRALLEEDLRSPCTEEIAVFRAFARTVGEGEDGFVVLDTAPTGHTHPAPRRGRRPTTARSPRRPGAMPEAVRELLPRLRDPDFTRY